MGFIDCLLINLLSRYILFMSFFKILFVCKKPMNPILGVSLVFSFSVFYSFSSKSTSSFSAFVKIPCTVLFFNPSSYGTAPLTYWRVCPIMYLVPSISIGSSRRISSSVPRKRPRYSKDCCFSSASRISLRTDLVPSGT